jgi:hypothetical protein
MPVIGGLVYAVTMTGVPESTAWFVVISIVVPADAEKSSVTGVPEAIASVVREPDALGLVGAYVAAVGPVTVFAIRVTAV